MLSGIMRGIAVFARDFCENMTPKIWRYEKNVINLQPVRKPSY